MDVFLSLILLRWKCFDGVYTFIGSPETEKQNMDNKPYDITINTFGDK